MSTQKSECHSLAATECPGSVQCTGDCKLAPENKCVERLETELATLRRRIAFFGCPEKLCLLCGAEGPCGLRPPREDGKPDWTASVMCQFAPTYPELVAIAHKAEAEVAALRRDRERLDWLDGEFEREHEWMVTAQWGNNPYRKSLFRKNEPITRDAIDAAMEAEREKGELNAD